MSIWDISRKETGDRIAHGEFNDIVSALRRGGDLGRGASGWDTQAVSAPVPWSPDSVQVYNGTGAEIDPFGIFAVSGVNILFDPEVPAADIGKIESGEAFNPLVLFTNGSLQIPNNTIGWATPIGRGRPYPITYTGTQPVTGELVGVRPGTFTVESMGSKGRCGLVAVQSDSDLVWVLASSESLLVKTDEEIDAISGTTLGSGNATVYYRDADASTLFVAKEPGDDTSNLQVTVYNHGQAVPSGTYVRAVPIVGIGLCIDPSAGVGRQGFGILTAADTFPGTTPMTLYNLLAPTVELVNDDDTDPVVSAQVGDAGPPILYDRLIAHVDGIYRIAFKVGLRIDSPASGYDDLVATVAGGSTSDLCEKIKFAATRFYLFKNANFGAPNVADVIREYLDVWNCYFCAKRLWFDAQFVTPIELEAGDEVSMWWDPTVLDSVSNQTYKAEVSLHYTGGEVELS